VKITMVTPPTGEGTIWSGEAVSSRQHYLWMADSDGAGCKAQSGKLSDQGHFSRNGVRYSRFYKSLRRTPSDLARLVPKAIREARS
jgi:hypothetical protein